MDRSPRFTFYPQSRNEKSIHFLNTEAPSESQWDRQHEIGHHGNTMSWDRAENTHISHADNNNNNSYGMGGMRVSDMLQPTRVNDVGLQRALKHSKMQSRPHRLNSADNAGRKKEGAELRLRPQSVSRQHDIVDIGGDDDDDRRLECRRRNTQPSEQTVNKPQPKVDVLAAFGRMSGGGASGDGRNSRNDAGALLTSKGSTSPPLPSTRSVDKAHGFKEPGDAGLKIQTTPHVYTQKLSAESDAQDRRYGGKQLSVNGNQPVTSERLWNPMHGNIGFTAIQPTAPSTHDKDKYMNPNAVAERILYALLQQNEEWATTAQNQSNKFLEEKDVNALGSGSGRATSFSASAASPYRPILQVTPQDSRLVLSLIHEKDREILQLRSSLVMSYRCAAYAIQRQRGQHAPGSSSSSSLSTMEMRFLATLASTINNTEKEVVPLLNRAPPHVHGLPNVPLPLGLSYSDSQVCGKLLMLDVENILQKKMSSRIFASSWHSYFVVADDRGLVVFRNEEDYKQHAFQRTLLIVPFKDMEYFVPSFHNLPIGDDELLDATNMIGPSRSQQRESSKGKSFLSFIGKGKRHKKETTIKTMAGDNTSEVEFSSDTIDSKDDDSRTTQKAGRGQLGRYDQLIARIALEYAGDEVYAYFGFIPKQPSTQAGGKVVNPPIIFRTKSAQEHAEWVHYFAQCFNRKLYREMFPSLLPETYRGRESKETQTVLDIIETAPVDSYEEEVKTDVVIPEDIQKAATYAVDAETQTTLSRQSVDASTNTEMELNGEKELLFVTPPPPSTTPPKYGVIGGTEMSMSVTHVEELPQLVTEKKTSANKEEELPWRELVTELRELLVTKNAEREGLQRECEELRHYVQKLSQEPQQIVNEPVELLNEVKKAHANYDAVSQRLQEVEQNFHTVNEAARAAEIAKQEAIAREQEQAALVKRLQEEMAYMQHEQDLLAAELRAVKEGYTEGIRSLAKKALGDIDQLHDVYSAKDYLCALRGDNHTNSTHEELDNMGIVDNEDSNCNDSNNTLGPQRRKIQLPHAPPPATSLRLPQFSPYHQPVGVDVTTKNTVQRDVLIEKSARKKARSVIATKGAEADSGAVGIAMLLISFAPHHMAIDGCFTVDESQARLLRSGPSITRRGRQWVILHHDTSAVFAVTAELQTEKDVSKLQEVVEGKSSKSQDVALSTTPPRKALMGRNSSRHVPLALSSSTQHSRERPSGATDVDGAKVRVGLRKKK